MEVGSGTSHNFYAVETPTVETPVASWLLEQRPKRGRERDQPSPLSSTTYDIHNVRVFTYIGTESMDVLIVGSVRCDRHTETVPGTEFRPLGAHLSQTDLPRRFFAYSTVFIVHQTGLTITEVVFFVPCPESNSR